MNMPCNLVMLTVSRVFFNKHITNSTLINGLTCMRPFSISEYAMFSQRQIIKEISFKRNLFEKTTFEFNYLLANGFHNSNLQVNTIRSRASWAARTGRPITPPIKLTTARNISRILGSRKNPVDQKLQKQVNRNDVDPDSAGWVRLLILIFFIIKLLYTYDYEYEPSSSINHEFY